MKTGNNLLTLGMFLGCWIGGSWAFLSSCTGTGRIQQNSRLQRDTLLFQYSAENDDDDDDDTADDYSLPNLDMNNEEPIVTGSTSSSGVVGVPQETEPIRTLGGGADLIFEMARQMLLWEETEDSVTSSSSSSTRTTTTTTSTRQKQKSSTSTSSVLPRWRPIRGVSDSNPAFRTSAPMMNSQGYAGTIWRNVRKANKPSLWRHALRTYDRMEQNTAKMPSISSSEEEDDNTQKPIKLKVPRANLHHEGALVACAKLGLWKKALQIYNSVEQERLKSTPFKYQKVFVTDNMVLSLIRSCVRASKQQDVTGSSTENGNSDSDTITETTTKTLPERREPLDACLEVLLSMEERHGLPLVARHVNPIAAAYQKLGLTQEASQLIQRHLEDRTSGPEEEDGDDPFNVNDIRAKDKGSYSLLVQSAVSDGNWEEAVDALRTMTEAGLYPRCRDLNAWTEVSTRKTKSWKKRRDEYWLENVR